MNNFTFYNPCRILFGAGQIDGLGKLVKQYSDNILLVYGKGSIKKSGLYDEVVARLRDEDISFTELSGVEANPKLDLVYEGIKIGREKQIGFILAVGGGSVIDTAKAIGVGMRCLGCTPALQGRHGNRTRWHGFDGGGRRFGDEQQLRHHENARQAEAQLDNEIIIPKFSILDPRYTCSVPAHQTACGAVDILSHLMERYFTLVKQADVTDRFLEGLMETILLYAPRALDNPDDLDARSELMWAGTLAQNGLLNTGRVGDWASHAIEHELSGEYDIAHGEGLAMITSSWMRYVYHNDTDRFQQFARRVFHVDYPIYDVEHTIQEGISRLEQFFTRMGLACNTAKLNMDEATMERLAAQAVYKSPTKGRFQRLTADDIVKVLLLSAKNR